MMSNTEQNPKQASISILLILSSDYSEDYTMNYAGMTSDCMALDANTGVPNLLVTEFLKLTSTSVYLWDMVNMRVTVYFQNNSISFKYIL